MMPLLIVDIFTLAILLLIFLSVHNSSGSYLIEQRIYMLLVLSAAFIVTLDMGMWVLDGVSGPIVRGLYYLITVLYYIFNPLICMIWYCYVDYQIYKSRRHLRRASAILSLPVLANALLSFLSIFGGYLFYIDAAGFYHRGPLFYVMALISFFYLTYAMVMMIVKRSRIKKRDFLPMLVFSIPPMVGGIIQSLIYGISLIWPCVTFSALIIFIKMQNSQLYIDYLTGLFNRRQLDNFLRQNSQCDGGARLAGIMIDLNAFKAINDIYGHHAGDEALCYTAQILKSTFKEDAFIARYGGDEFLVLMPVRGAEELTGAVARLKESLRRFNAQRTVPYALDLSLGCDYYTGSSEADVASFLKHIDKLMYQDKRRRTDTSQ